MLEVQHEDERIKKYRVFSTKDKEKLNSKTLANSAILG
jgi:hypothetical protein